MKNDDIWQLDGKPGPALPISDDELGRLVGGAVGRAFASPEAPGASETKSVFAGSKHLIIGAGAVACIVAAWATYATESKRSPEAGPAAAAPVASATSAAAPMASPVVSPSPVIADQVPSIDVQALPSAPNAPDRAPQGSIGAQEAPRDLLREANRLRAERRWSDAAALYRRVAQARSEESEAAMLALASLRLEHQNDAKEARQLYRAVVDAQPDGPLAEEARWGVAMACHALGDREGERAALTTFLARHPASLSAPKAQKRLADLGADKNPGAP